MRGEDWGGCRRLHPCTIFLFCVYFTVIEMCPNRGIMLEHVPGVPERTEAYYHC